MKFDRSNKFDLCYYGQENTFGGNIYFAGNGTSNACENRVGQNKLMSVTDL